MPRRTAQQAQKAAIKEGLARIRLLIRNPQFRKDLMELRKLRDPFGWDHAHASAEAVEEATKAADKFDPSKLGTLTVKFPKGGNKPIKTYWEFLKKWDLDWFPSKLFNGSSELTGTEKADEQVLIEELKKAQHAPRSRDRYIQRPAVVASEPFDEWYEDVLENWDGTNQVVAVPDHIPGPGRVLNIQVDLSYPQDVIEAEIKNEVRNAKQRRRALEKKGLLPPRPERLRLDKIEFQLTVYELAKKGETFRNISGVTKRPVSTVKSALLAVSKKIASLVIPAISPQVVQKKTLPLADFDPNSHISQCPQCSSAERLDGMCDLARRYVNQDYVSQRELPGVDTVHDVRDLDTAD